MDIYFPKTARGLIPVVLFVHGGAWIQGDKTEGAGIEDIPALVDAGFAVAAVNYRLAPEYKFPAMIEDVKSAVRFLRSVASDYGLDPNKIGAYGGSAGGHLVSLLGVTDVSAGWDNGTNAEYSSRVQAVVDMFGPANLALVFPPNAPTNPYNVFGTNDPRHPILTSASPTTWATSDDPPFLILHGDQDSVVPLAQSQQLYKSLINVGVEAQLIVVKNGGHGWRNSPNMEPTRDEITQMIVRFFNTHLQ